MIENVNRGRNVKIPFPNLCNLYGCTIGDGSFVGPFVEIQRGVTIGTHCKIESHTFICSGVAIADRVFVGHGVMFTNDHFPAIDAEPQLFSTLVHGRVVIGSGATILPVTIGEGAVIGAGSVVTTPVPKLSLVVGNPARVVVQWVDFEAREKYFASRKRNDLLALS
jgi:UDP-2-acetamido-3-amino-2,3-dideoxy-glucuronate N-acetyltransferase